MEAHNPLWQADLAKRKARPKRGVVVQVGMNLYAVRLEYRNDKTVYYLYEGSSDGLRTFMSIDTAVRWIRHQFIRTISVEVY